MSERTDLSRWNRAGLRYFRYVDGNAADYLERLRDKVQQSFPGWQAIAVNGDATDDAESDREAERLKRALDFYYGERGDWGWEILRAFARATHVICEHIDAYANEGFLETATQWDNVRKLVEMLDYHPAPPSSASTPLVLVAKQGRRGLVAKGFQVKYTPPEGGAPVVFETLEDIQVDAGLNGLHLRNWNRSGDQSPQDWDPFVCKGDADYSPWVLPEKAEVSVGDIGILLQEPERKESQSEIRQLTAPIRIAKINRAKAGLCIEQATSIIGQQAMATDLNAPPQASAGNIRTAAEMVTSWNKGHSRLLLSPKGIYIPDLNGADIVCFGKPHGLLAGEVICWKQASRWFFNRVVEQDDTSLSLADSCHTPSGVVYKALSVPGLVNKEAGELEYRLPLQTVAACYVDGSASLHHLDLEQDFDQEPGTDNPSYIVLKAGIAVNVLYLYSARSDLPSIGTVADVGVDEYRFAGDPGDLQSGDWVVGEFTTADGQGELQVLNIERIDALEDEFILLFTSVSRTTERRAGFVPSLAAIEMVLDEPVFNTLTLAQLASGKAGDRDVSAIQGIGEHYAQTFKETGIYSIADLAKLDPERDIREISPVRRREFITKAKLVLAYSGTSIDSASATSTLAQAVEKSAAPAGVASTQRLLRLYGAFTQTLRPAGYDVNSRPLVGAQLTLDLPATALPESLKPGRAVILEQASGLAGGNPKQALVKTLTGNVITLNLMLAQNDGFTLGNTIIRGNVVTSGHGAFKGEKVLGSGDATQGNQSFIFKVPAIAFVADSTMPSGVRADITLRVDERSWQQVSTLRDSAPADPHYTVRMTEAGFLNIGFGDGENGRRLPSGVNNIRVAYRVGSGLSGNVTAHGLQKPVKPHKLLDAVDQPITATGGNDMEGTASLRDNAPASLLTLERAVSLNDFANLSVSQSSVWQARAFAQSTLLGRQVSVRVVLVPAGGAGLDEEFNALVPGSFLENQVRFLKAHSQPGIEISAFVYQPVLIDVKVTIRVKFDEYDAEATKDKVRGTLQQVLGLQQRKLGQPFYRSELYQIVESVVGVENSECFIQLPVVMEDRPLRVNTQALNGEEIIRSIQPKQTQVIYFDPGYSSLQVEAEEFAL